MKQESFTPEEMYKYIKKNHLEGDLFDMEMNNLHNFHFIPIHGTLKKDDKNLYIEHAEDCVIHIPDRPDLNKIILKPVEENDDIPIGCEVWGYIIIKGNNYEVVFLETNTEQAENIMKETVDMAFIEHVKLDNPRKFRYMKITANEIKKNDLIS